MFESIPGRIFYRLIPILYFLLFITPSCGLFAEKEFIIAIDPGHGGSVSHRKDDKWDPVTGKYLAYYNSGMVYKSYEEHKVVLELAKKLRSYLELTNTQDGWLQFKEILAPYSTQDNFEKIRFRVIMTREYGWDEKFKDPEAADVNAEFRLYDYPEDETNPQRPYRMGRLSYVNSQKPHLVISLHLTPAGRGNPGGMTAVLAPGYRTFNLIRQIHLDREPVRKFYSLEWMKHGNWLVTDDGWSKYQSARADTWVYFHGFRSVKNGSGPWRSKNRGLRQNMVRWRYTDPAGWEKAARKGGPGPYSLSYTDFKATGAFWDREKSQAELWRREDGPAGFGGDNHYASDELMRFVQFGVRKITPELNTSRGIGPIQKPYISAYTLPTFLNAIVAYLEIGHLNVSRDRSLLIDHSDETARSMAAGVYSLFNGMSLNTEDVKTKYLPRGKPLDFQKYEELPGGSYFDIVTD